MFDLFNTDPLASDSSILIDNRLPILGKAVREVQQYYQAPFLLCLNTALAAVSTACQFDVVITTPVGQKVPGQLNILTIAPPGERKSPVMGAFMKPIQDYDDALNRDYEDECKGYKFSHKKWKIKGRIIERELKLSLDNGDDDIDERLLNYIESEPKKPHRRQIVYQDTSPTGFFDGLSGFKIGALVSSEGGLITEGRLIEEFAHLNELWSGNATVINRGNDKKVLLSDVRMTTLIMIQDGVLNKQNRRLAEKIKDSGYWSRFIVAKPTTTQGTRMFQGQGRGADFLTQFNERMAEIISRLHNTIDKLTTERKELVFSPEAADYWVEMANYIEGQILPGGRYENAGDHASKLPEIVARIAGLVHYFEGFDGAISKQTVSVAFEICDRSSRDYMDVFAPKPNYIGDADDLLTMLRRYQSNGQYPLEKNFARRYGPNKIRPGTRFHDALVHLINTGAVTLQRQHDRKEYIYINWNPVAGVGGYIETVPSDIGRLLFS